MSLHETDPTKPTEELLRKILWAASDRSHPGLPLVGFATLLVKISREASVTADKNMTIQRRMIYITVVILFISITQLALGLLQFFSVYPADTQQVASISTSGIGNDPVRDDKTMAVDKTLKQAK